MGSIDKTLEALMENIKTIVKSESTRLADEEANKFTGSNIPGIEHALKTSKVADAQVEIELKKHIQLQDEDKQKEYYKVINNRKKDTILDDLQSQYDNQEQVVKDARDLFEAIGNLDNVNASEYYRLKNDDIIEKIKDISGVELTNKRKAYYNLDYINNMQKIKDNIYSIYVLVTITYIVFFVRAKKYRSRLDILILISVILYPFVINTIMAYILGLLDYIFSLAPVNAYRNLYNENINLSTSRDDDIYLHYSKVRDE
tara:strand:+ start:489 stop:1262 length:774 start_codon:yes stop_codon:yes gene_type:complete